MDVCWQYLVSAPLGGVLGGLGHALVSDNTFTRKQNAISALNFSGFRDIGVGFFSGLVWLLPNQNTWVNQPLKVSDLVLMALQTMIIGLAGSGWLTSYLNTNVLKGTVAKAAGSGQDPAISNQINGGGSVSQIVDLVSKLPS